MDGQYCLMTNRKCNLNCFFCADDDKIKSLPEMSYEDKIDLIENYKYLDTFTFTGGEPTICKDLIKLVYHAKKKCNYKVVRIVSNGIMLSSEEYLKRLVKAGMDSIQLSYYTTSEKTFDEITRTKKLYPKLIQALENIKKLKIDYNINCVISKFNYKELKEILKTAIKYNCNRINFAFFHPVGTSVINGKSQLLVRIPDIMPFINELLEYAQRINFNNLGIENIPLCYFDEKHFKYISDINLPEPNKEYNRNGKVLLEKCKSCKRFDICPGIWNEYIRQIGNDNDIKPILK
jgi:MoaA/NifB/PqqE/SkfB family radical SAM enzyme